MTGATGATPIGTRLQGEVYQVNPPDVPGSYTVTVETTVNGQEVSGQASTTATYPTASMQADKRELSIFASTAGNAGPLDPLNSDDDAVLNGYTVFSPSNKAFLDALVAAQDQSAVVGFPDDTLNVSGTFVSKGGFVVARDSTELANGNMTGSVVGYSRYLPPGFYKEIIIVTDEPLDAQPGESVTLTFTAHWDTDDNQVYYNPGALPGSDDGPYMTSGDQVPNVV